MKAQSEAEIHAAEDAARKKMNPNGAVPPKPEAWYQAPRKPARAWRACSRSWIASNGSARLVIQTADGKTMQLLMADPSQVSLGGGGGEQTLAAVRRRIRAKWWFTTIAKPDAKLHTVGEVITDRIPLS